MPGDNKGDFSGGPASHEDVIDMSKTDGRDRSQWAIDGTTRDANGSVLLDIYHRLLARYGPQHWWPGDSRLEIVLGAILTQSTAWTNVEKALTNIRGAGLLSVQQLKKIPRDRLATHIRPSGFFNAKTKKVKAFIDHLCKNYGGDLELFLSKEMYELREELLSIYGIGEETADDILLYAAAKPSFVIDSYTRRILKRLRLAPITESYQAYQGTFHQNLPAESALYNEYHALLDRHAKETCKSEPLCGGCCLLELCPTGRAYVDTPESKNL